MFGSSRIPPSEILIVEDSKTEALKRKSVIESEVGLKVVIAANAAEAVRAVGSHEFLAILLDTYIPGARGPDDVYNILKQLTNAKIIRLSASPHNSDVIDKHDHSLILHSLRSIEEECPSKG